MNLVYITAKIPEGSKIVSLSPMTFKIVGTSFG
jgi:hypothetical protein